MLVERLRARRMNTNMPVALKAIKIEHEVAMAMIVVLKSIRVGQNRERVF